ncbi:putative protein kinase RLK-Pelle-LRR-IX family [Helianthus debilis subsp. tardiflorus]
MKKTHLPFLSLTFTLSLITVHSQSNDSDVMQTLKHNLDPSTTPNWSDPNPCNWVYVTCSKDNRVTGIQANGLNLKGSLPQTLNNLTQLQLLELQFNQLSGPLPSLTGLTQLQNLIINNNNFTSIPNDFFDGMSSLQNVYLDYNAFDSWSIPHSLKIASNLHIFSATATNLTGKIPDFFGNDTFTGLVTLRLALNCLEGGLPNTFSGSLIQSLWLNGQQSLHRLNGSVGVLQNMTQLTEVWLHGNLFSGPLPQLWGLNKLQSLSLSNNSLTGTVPHSLTGLQSLKVLNLSNNMFQGPMPKFDASVSVDMTGIGSFCLQEPGVECDSRVNLLVAVAESVGYPQLFAEKWKGNDPCNLWLGITCSSSGEITVVNFRKMGLTGTISTNFSSIMSLQRLILADNNLTGVIPNELKDLPHLVEIDVSHNQLYGKVPSFKENVTVVTHGNPKMETDGPTATPVSPSGGDQRPKGNGGGGGNGGGDRGSDSGGGGDGRGGRGRSNTGIFVGCFIGGVGTVLLMALLAYCVYKLKIKLKVTRSRSPVNHSTMVVHPRHSGSDGDGVKITIDDACTDNRSQEINSMSSSGPSDNAIEVGNLLISIQVLKSVTNNFSPSNILGRGGFGTVYKGELHDGTKIAVKRMELSITNEKGLFEFQSEISVLTKVRHRHLVALLGYCLDGNERLLVLEYMPQGALSRFLFNWESEDLKPLDWTTRLVIALDVAKGVEYLHGLAQQSFIHRDLKPSNILLGDDMRAKVGDFGLVRLAPDGKVSLVTQLAGTFGYLAPEYAVAGRVTTKIDVFSFGVILMELITGRKALEETQPEDSVHLVQWFKKMHINKATFRKAIDPCLEPFLDETALASVTMVAELAGHCCAREPYQRPDMSHAVNVLSSLTDLWKPTESDQDDIYGIDLDTPLPQVVKRWQAMDNESGRTDNTRSSLASLAYAHHDPMPSTINSDGENRF